MNDEPTIRIPVGIGTRLDGGPFYDAEVTDAGSGELYIETSEGQGSWEDARDVEESLSTAIRNGEPLLLDGTEPEQADAHVEVPAEDAYIIHTFDGIQHPLRGPESVRMIQDYINQYGAKLRHRHR